MSLSTDISRKHVALILAVFIGGWGVYAWTGATPESAIVFTLYWGMIIELPPALAGTAWMCYDMLRHPEKWMSDADRRRKQEVRCAKLLAEHQARNEAILAQREK